MKKIKYLFIVLILYVLLANLYQNYIYYLIPYNPLEDITDNPYSCHFTINYSNDGITNASYNLNTNTLIFKYFSDLNLIPLKEETNKEEIFKHDNDINFSYRFRFHPPKSSAYYYITIDEIWLDNLSVLYIRSNKPGFHNGYYKIIDSKFDYKYVNDLINTSQK
ncbi:hypothetical protein [Paramaledivibacter caminithermalis]|jgi:hypothetical protein|uniref:Uncharacterized protein n=1 Tax=Paramaledivibacter caminithermalis (strain DSM 15212 / CIP 107654 / DViRD3) TaxID=1121301 RepID=A0A1M6TX76_PARC5|nr:hypothetical protein [Paramaledivibacter caminithermalis]SHK61500.1 hypothetical protein SAMN02745912_03818 [Paramaledivibacter caminithermalis DSM 15212]